MYQLAFPSVVPTRPDHPTAAGLEHDPEEDRPEARSSLWIAQVSGEDSIFGRGSLVVRNCRMIVSGEPIDRDTLRGLLRVRRPT
jgi:hypothetical protein